MNPKRRKAADSAWEWLRKQREPFTPGTLFKGQDKRSYDWIRKWVWFWRDYGRLERTENGYFFKRPLEACSKGPACVATRRLGHKIA